MVDSSVSEPAAGSYASPAASGEQPGMAVVQLVAVMRRLLAPGGCPWDREQTHQSLTQYCLEEAYEVVDAIENGTRDDLVEELGDLLLQVVFHAQIGTGDPQPFDIDDVARGITAKLIRRHPFVFEGGDPTLAAIAGRPATAAQQHSTWDQIKTAEKHRTSVLDGIPPAMGAAARAHKVVGRAQRAGMDVPALLREAHTGDYAAQLLAMVAQAQELGVDAEGELRRATAALEARIRAHEASPQPEDE